MLEAGERVCGSSSKICSTHNFVQQPGPGRLYLRNDAVIINFMKWLFSNLEIVINYQMSFARLVLILYVVFPFTYRHCYENIFEKETCYSTLVGHASATANHSNGFLL